MTADGDRAAAPGTALVILFKLSGKYYTEEPWRIPERAIGPYDMKRSPDFRRIDGGAVLVDTQEPWGYPHLFPSLGVSPIDAAHQRIHRLLGTTCPQVGPLGSDRISCTERDVAFAALDVDDPEVQEMPWRPGNSVLDGGNS